MERGIFEIVDTESLVPAGHLLRKIDAAVDFNSGDGRGCPLHTDLSEDVQGSEGNH